MSRLRDKLRPHPKAFASGVIRFYPHLPTEEEEGRLSPDPQAHLQMESDEPILIIIRPSGQTRRRPTDSFRRFHFQHFQTT